MPDQKLTDLIVSSPLPSPIGATDLLYVVRGSVSYATSGANQPTLSLLASTGSILDSKINSLSGYGSSAYSSITNLQLTGQQNWNALNGIGVNLSGNLTQTGVQLLTSIISLSGWSASALGLFNTGSNLYSMLVGLSGEVAADFATKVTVAATGQQAWSAADSNGRNLSGNLTSTGVQLGISIASLSGSAASAANLALTGQQAWLAANSNGINLSGNLTQTGVQLAATATTTYATIVNLGATGQQAWSAADANGRNISGNLTSTGVQLGVSITSLSGWSASAANLALTGQQAWSAANANGINLSGNLTQTGVQLAATVAATYATIVNLGTTGQQAWTAANNNGINLSGSLVSSGNSLVALNLSTSGALITQISANAAGVSTLNGLSGVLTLARAGTNVFLSQSGTTTIFISGSGIAQSLDLALTGQQAWLAANVNGINLSGNLTQTGVQLAATAVATYATITNLALTGSILFALTTGLSGQAVATYLPITTAAATYATLSNLALTGSNLYVLVTGLSGQAVSTYLPIATATTTYATIANLATTGSNLYALVTGLSGQAVSTYLPITTATATYATIANLALTGSSLYGLFTGASGQANTNFATVVNLASTGQQAWTAANSNTVTMSGNLTQTGVQLAATAVATYATIANLALTGSSLYATLTGSSGQANTNYATVTNLGTTGQQAWSAANNNGINLSGNLTTTGATLFARDLSISGALQALISAGGTQVTATGSSLLSTANFNGLGGTKVILSGASAIFISGYQPETFIVACSNLTSALAVTTNAAYFDSPFDMYAFKTSASVLGAPAGSSIVVNIQTGGRDFISPKISISGTTLTSINASGVISGTMITSGTRISFNIDAVGSVNAGTGLNTTLYCLRA